MIKKILKLGGFTNEADFYKKYPTEASFMAEHGHKLKTDSRTLNPYISLFQLGGLKPEPTFMPDIEEVPDTTLDPNLKFNTNNSGAIDKNKNKDKFDVSSAAGAVSSAGSTIDADMDKKNIDERGFQDVGKAGVSGGLRAGATGAAAGFQIGSLIPIPGANLVGAAAGFIGGATYGTIKDINQAKDDNKDLARKYSNYYAGLPKMTSANSYQVRNGGFKLENGGDKSVNSFNGESHENGGIKLTDNAEVEGGETSYKDYVFSDSLNVPGKKITFAQVTKRLEAKYKGRENDQYSERAKEQALTKLMQENEMVKAMEERKQAYEQEVEQIKMRFGGLKTHMMPDGSMMEGAVRKMVNGGLIKGKAYSDETGSYDASGNKIADAYGQVHGQEQWKNEENFKNSWREDQNLDPMIDSPGLIDWNDRDYYNNYVPGTMLMKPIDYSNQKSNQLNDILFKSDTEKKYLVKSPSKLNDQDVKEDEERKNKKKFGNEEIALGLSMLPSMYNVAKGWKPTVTNFQNINPNLVNLEGEREALRREAGKARLIANENVRQIGGGSGSALAALATQSSAINDSKMKGLSDSYQREQIANVGTLNDMAVRNTGINNEEILANEQNQAMPDSLKSLGLSDLSSNAQDYLRDKKLTKANEKSNKMKLDAMNSLFPNYKWGINKENDELMMEYVMSIGGTGGAGAYTGSSSKTKSNNKETTTTTSTSSNTNSGATTKKTTTTKKG